MNWKVEIRRLRKLSEFRRGDGEKTKKNRNPRIPRLNLENTLVREVKEGMIQRS